MRQVLDRLYYVASTLFFGVLAIFFVGVCITSLTKNAIYMYVILGLDWRLPGNYVGLIAGFGAYVVFAVMLWVMRMRHNLDWSMKFTHELTHTLVALCFGRKIYEFVVRGRECHVYYKPGFIGYLPITLSPYCIPIYTFMIFPFRFAGDAHYMIVFDALIAFTYAFHLQSFLKQTRFSQPDIANSGRLRAVAFLAFVHLAVLSLILATPKGGVCNAIYRVFCVYPYQIVTDPTGWWCEVIQYF
jgi:hypothetical protein